MARLRLWTGTQWVDVGPDAAEIQALIADALDGKADIADLAALLPKADVLNEPDMATGATDKPPSQASVVDYVLDRLTTKADADHQHRVAGLLRSIALGGAASLPEPLLLLRPGASRDRNGSVTPTVSGGVTTTPGTYGTAWVLSDGQSITIPSTNRLNTSEGTILIRMTRTGAAGSTQDVFGKARTHATGKIRMVMSNHRPRVIIGSSGNGDSSDTSLLPVGTGVMIGLRYDSGTAWNIYNSTITSFGAYTFTDAAGDWTIGPLPAQTLTGYQVESVLVFEEALSDAEIERIRTIPAAWTWENVTLSGGDDKLALGEGAVAGADHTTAIGPGIIVTEPHHAKIGGDDFEVQPSSGSGASTLTLYHAGQRRTIGVTADAVTVDGNPISGGGGAVSEAEKLQIQADLLDVGTGVSDLETTVTDFLATPGAEVYAARDRFIDTNGTLITAHAPDTGGTWTAYGISPVIQGNALVGGAGTGGAVISPIGTDVHAAIAFVVGSSSGAGIIVRAQDSSNYWYAWYEHGSTQMRIYEVVSGTGTVRVSAPLPLTTGQLAVMTVRVFGPHIVMAINGTQLQWDEIPEAGQGVGVRIGGSATGNVIRQVSVRQIDAPATPVLPTITATNAASPLVLPTMYGDTQGTHPDVIDFGAGGWNGYRYWMIWTPHTNGNTPYENPSMAVSNNGTTWTTPPGLTNPIIDWPGVVGSYNSDPDMVYHAGRLYLMYRTTNHPASTSGEALWVTESANGVHWDEPVKVLERTPTQTLVSPALVYRRGRWHMWVINSIAPGRYRMVHRTALSPYGPWSAPQDCVMPMPGPKIDLWHIDVVDLKSKFALMASSADRTISGAGMDGNMYYGESYDGIHWNLAAEPFLENTADGTSWDDAKLYRPSFVTTPTGYDLFYSAYGTDGTWHIGRTAVTVT